MDIFKLFFDHDLRLDQLAKRNANKTKKEVEASLEDFMKPIPTYSKFYLTGTRLSDSNDTFGLDVLDKHKDVLDQLDKVFKDYSVFLNDSTYATLKEAIESAGIGDAILITHDKNPDIDMSELQIDNESNVGHFKEELSEVLLEDHLILYKEQAHDGYDLHLFSKQNIYERFFYAFKELIGDTFRFFSINSKRMGSERHFYFETWTLDRPPHGAEEVLPETVL